MNALLQTLKLLGIFAVLGAVSYTLYEQVAPLLQKPCENPITYAAVGYDARFGISEMQFETALVDAERVWEEAAGRELFIKEPEGDVGVYLVYGDIQKTAELGEVIGSEQAAYDAKKEELEKLKKNYAHAEQAYSLDSAEYDKLSATYHTQVNYWNSKGGAPAAVYDELTAMRQELEGAQEKLQERAQDINAIATSINARVDELNAFAKTLNAKVDVYNENVPDEFDQGDYKEDREGKRITIYEFSDVTDLKRVLIHEFGHALGLGHVENPASIMYSFNAGTSLLLSQEDITALRAVCGLD